MACQDSGSFGVENAPEIHRYSQGSRVRSGRQAGGAACDRRGKDANRSGYSQVVCGAAPGLVKVRMLEKDRHQNDLEDQEHEHEQASSQQVENSADNTKAGENESDSADDDPERCAPRRCAPRRCAERHPLRNHGNEGLCVCQMPYAGEDSADSNEPARDKPTPVSDAVRPRRWERREG